MLSLLFLSLLATPASAVTSAYETGGYLAGRLRFLSQLEAVRYAGDFDRLNAECQAAPATESAEDRRACLDRAVEAIRARAEVDFPESALRYRYDQLRREGYLNADEIPAKGPVWGVLGDSIAMGAMAHNRIGADLPQLLAKGIFDFVFRHLESGGRQALVPSDIPGDQSFRGRATRIFDTPSSHKLGFSRLLENRGSSYIDCPECSFAYSLAKDFGVPEQNLFFAGQSGKRVNTFYEQLERLALPLGHLPDVVLVSYSGNDLCNPGNATDTAEGKYQQIHDDLVKYGQRAMRELAPAPGGTKIVVLAAPDLTQVLDRESALNQRVPYRVPGTGAPAEVACRDLRVGRYPLLDQLNNICKYVLNTHPDDQARIGHVRELNEAMVRAQADAVRDLRAEASAAGRAEKFRFVFAESFHRWRLEEGDLANDCAHPSLAGHGKISRWLKPELEALIGR